MKKLALFINPISGKADILSLVGSMVDYYNKKDFEVTVYVTQRRAEINSVLEKNIGVYDTVVSCGGDGTLNETINGLMNMPEDKRPKLGYVPCGSTNDFANSLGIEKSYTDAYQLAVDGKATAIDIGQFNDEYFSYVSAFGAFTSIPYETPQTFKNVLGYQAYVLEGVKQLSKIESVPMRITYDDGVLEDEFILGLVSNSSSIAGFKDLLSTNTDLSDGLFEVLLLKKSNSIADLSKIISALAEKKFDNEIVYSFKTSSITFETTDNTGVKWTIDGEFAGNCEKAEIGVCHKAIKINI